MKTNLAAQIAAPARKHPAAIPVARAMLLSSMALAASMWACDRADAAPMPLHRAKTLAIGEKHRHEAAPAPVLKGPLQIVISIGDQKISVYSGDALVARSAVSTGVPDHPTPMGVFTVIQKQRWHRSNLYSDAPMPYMQRITWSGVALHAGVLPGHPASHGCIRLTEEFAIRLWQLTKLGNRVIIARNDVAPVDISHPQLFAQRRKPEISAPAAMRAETSRSAEAAIVPSADGFVEPVKAVERAVDPTAAPEPRKTEQPASLGSDAQAKPPAAKVEPISVFISRKQGKLFVRQGFDPLFETAVTIRDPDRPLGTHVFTAIERKDIPARCAGPW